MSPGRSRIVLVGIAALELAWLAWFFSVPLAHARPIRRYQLILMAIPGRAGESILGQTARELSHVEHLPQRLPIVLAAAFIAASALAVGRISLRLLRQSLGPWERTLLAFGLGTIGLALSTLALGRLGRLDPWVIRASLALPIIAEAACLIRSRTPIPNPHLPAPTLPFVVLMGLGAMVPTLDFDALEYHLQGPKEYYQSGRIAFLPHNVYTSMPSQVEMLHLLGMEVLDDWWSGALVGQVLVMLHTTTAAGMIALIARRWASERAAWFAAIVYLTTPWIGQVAMTPFVEGPLCYFHAALIWSAARAWSTDSEPVRVWLVVGLLAGGAFGCKYPALISAVVPFGLIASLAGLRRRSWRIPMVFALGVAIVAGPWLVKNANDTGNPVYPLAYRVFGGRNWNNALDAKFSAAHGPKPITGRALADDLTSIAGRSDGQSPLYLALIPLAFARPGSRRRALILLGYVAYLILTWWLLTHRIDRFWLPLLPAVAVLAGLGADWTRGRGWSALLAGIVAIALVANLVFLASGLAGPTDWTGDLAHLRREAPRKANPALAWLDSTLPQNAKVLLVGQAGVFHVEHPIVYNTVFNPETFETLARGRSPAQVGREFARLGITHVYVDWSEIARYRSPGNYGFTPFVTPGEFRRLVAAGVLDPPPWYDPGHALYMVRAQEDDHGHRNEDFPGRLPSDGPVRPDRTGRSGRPARRPPGEEDDQRTPTRHRDPEDSQGP